MSEMQQTTSLCGGVKKAKQSKAPRRPAQFWAPLNNWCVTRNAAHLSRPAIDFPPEKAI